VIFEIRKKERASATRLEVDKMDFIVDKNKHISLYKDFGNVSVLPYHFKQQRKGCWIYLPSQLIDVLGIETGKDGSLLAFILDDLDSPYNFLVLTKDNFILDKLRPQLLDIKFKSLTKLQEIKKTASSENVSSDTSLQNDI